MSKVWGGIKKVGAAILPGVGPAISAAMGASGGGPGAAAMAGISQLLPGVANGLTSLIPHSTPPGGPRNLPEAANMFSGRGIVDGVRSAIASPLFRDAAHSGASVLSNMMTDMSKGVPWRAAASNAGANSWLVSQGGVMGNALMNKVDNAMGANPRFVAALGNPYLRMGLGAMGMGSVGYEGIRNGIQNAGTSLAIRAINRFIPQDAAMTGGRNMPAESYAPPPQMGGGGGGGEPTGASMITAGGAPVVNYTTGGGRASGF